MTRRFHFVVYYNDNELGPRKNTRNDDVSTHKFCSRTRCRSEILTSLISTCHEHDILTLHQPIRLQHFERGNEKS